ncbi:THO complex subunit 1-like [Ylistrum balloti]|uniref:THO complex subunit 1-like n=1 Tax=Ylistrum balloti TaxID=509963 RepID=UPI002905E2CE|nr:THO complex subunit 1-like [Ylistrum balloti]
MGSYASQFMAPVGDEVSQHTHPSKANWITVHAIASELSIAETERLWLRFQQLGCNKDGVITEDLATKMSISNDAFSRNLMKKFTLNQTKDITFENFLRGLKWCEIAEPTDKLRGIFRLLNNGNPVPKTTFVKILERVYTNPSDKKDVQRVAEIVYKHIDKKNTGLMNEDQFVTGVRSVIPGETLEDILNFEVLPTYMKERLHSQLPEFNSEGPTPDPGGRQIPSDASLRQVAEKIYRRDWLRTANKLGLTNEEVSDIKANISDSKNQAYTMLKTWKDREAAQAYTSVLESALKESGMTDAAYALML